MDDRLSTFEFVIAMAIMFFTALALLLTIKTVYVILYIFIAITAESFILTKIFERRRRRG